MDDALFHKIVNDAAALGVERILLFLNGEPFVFPRFFEWMQVLRQHGIITTIFTNASHLTEEATHALVRFKGSIDDLFISAVGIDTETHREIMGLTHTRVLENVIRFAEINRGQIRTTVSMPGLARVQPWVDEWERLWRPIIGRVQVTGVYTFCGLIHDPNEYRGRKTYCSRMEMMTVLWDGRVCLCCFDAEGRVILGDLNYQTIQQVFASDRSVHYRRMNSQGRWAELDLCRDCNVNVTNP